MKEQKAPKVKTVNYGLRMQETLYDEIANISQRADRSMANVIARILRKALNDPDFMREALSPEPVAESSTGQNPSTKQGAS